MHLTYENTNEEIIVVKRKPRHQPPHLHNAMEIVCVTKGTLELGVGQELYHMETGDIGVVFPDVLYIIIRCFHQKSMRRFLLMLHK